MADKIAFSSKIKSTSFHQFLSKNNFKNKPNAKMRSEYPDSLTLMSNLKVFILSFSFLV